MSAMSRPEEERDPVADEEAEAAAAEAARIGGNGGYSDTDDPAKRPLSEAGEGEAEGFELAEEQLEEIAEHGDQHRFPVERDVPQPEEPTDAAYGEPDQAIPDDE